MRTVPATVTSAIAKAATKPVYLVHLIFDATSSPINQTYSATWSANISWNGITWTAQGLEVNGLSVGGCTLEFPNGAADPWLSLVLNTGVVGKTCNIYEWHEDTTVSPTTDAVLVFVGVMDEAVIEDDSIRVRVVESRDAKSWPPTSIDQPTFTHLARSGERIAWGDDVVVVQ